jgi:hypothetical protein
MLVLHLPEIEEVKAVELRLEHSLVSLSKWESKYEKPFFSKEDKSEEELKDYILMMVLNDPVPEWVLERMSLDHYSAINTYLNSKRSATWFNEFPGDGKKSTEQVTSELIYYWMVAFRIPFEAQYWHLNRLMTLVKICGMKQTPPKKMSKHAQMAEYRRLNEQRKQKLGTSG